MKMNLTRMIVALAFLLAGLSGCKAPQSHEPRAAEPSNAQAQPQEPAATQPDSSVPAVTVHTADSDDGRYRLTYSTRPDPLPLNEMFTIDASIASLQGDRAGPAPWDVKLSVDARMPEHQHGMNVEPKVENLGGGRFRISRMLFHMPGHWELYFDIAQNGVTTRVQFEVNLD